jgi:hypothetical protein
LKARLIFIALPFWLMAQARLLPAAPIRVTSWDLQPGAAASSSSQPILFQQSMVQTAAGSLKQMRPDVILLQHVADWQTCQQIAQALRPEIYQVAACSSFRDPRGKLLRGQVAILARTRAILAWSEPWQGSGQSPAAPGGFAFAAVRLGDKNIGILAVQQAGRESISQLVQQIVSLQNWQTNRLQAYVVAGEFEATNAFARLQQLGFVNALAGLPPDKQAALDYIFTRDAGLISSPLVAQTAFFEHEAVTCEMDLAAPKAIAAATPAKATTSAGSPHTPLWYAGFLAGGLVLFVLVRKITLRSTLQPVPAHALDLKAKTAPPPFEKPPYVQIEVEGSTQTQSQTWRPHQSAERGIGQMPEVVRAGVIANLSRWLKQKVVQRLLSDRAQLLATQQAAALKVAAVDERLAKVEHHIQQRNRDYERRIDDLLKALITAEEENRVLIRAQIDLLKAEMEKTRPKAGPHGHEHEPY